MHVLVASTYVAAHGNVRTPGAPRAKLRQRARLSRAEAADALKKVCAPLAVVGFLGARACFAPCAASARSECAPAFSRAPGVDECACQAWSNDQFSLRGFANPIPASPMPSSANVAGSGSSDSGRLAAKKFPSSFATDSCASVALVTVK